MNRTDTRTAAQVLRAVADWFEEDTSRWGRDVFVDDGCARCVLGGIAYVVDPEDTDGDPLHMTGERSAAAEAAVRALTDYLVLQGIVSLPLPEEDWYTPVHTVGGWNDAADRTVHEVIGTLRAAARWSEERAS